jgi:hypothetical protein
MTRLSIRPPHSIIFISDVDWCGDPPDGIEEKPIAFTDDCVVVWSYPEIDGETQILINEECDGDLVDVGDVVINIPNGIVVISDSSGTEVFRVPLSPGRAMMRVRMDNMTEPRILGIDVREAPR